MKMCSFLGHPALQQNDFSARRQMHAIASTIPSVRPSVGLSQSCSRGSQLNGSRYRNTICTVLGRLETLRAKFRRRVRLWASSRKQMR